MSEYYQIASIDAHYNLGMVLASQRRIDEAIAEYRWAIRLAPDFAKAHTNLGHALRQLGKFRPALEELQEGHALGSKQRNWPDPSGQWVRQVEKDVELEDQLPAVLRGARMPGGPEEIRSLAELCHKKQLYGASARFWRDAFLAQPSLAENPQAGHRYKAACDATLAGCGQGRDVAPLDDRERTEWRTQALAWLKAELALFSKVLENGKPEARAQVRRRLAQWKRDPDLAGLREPTALSRLPAAERRTWQELWSEVEVVLAQARGPRGVAPGWSVPPLRGKESTHPIPGLTSTFPVACSELERLTVE